MKVLYLLRYYPTLTETFVYQEITSLRKHFNVDITIASLAKRKDGYKQDRLPQVPVLQVPKMRFQRWRALQPSEGMRWVQQWQRNKDSVRLLWLQKHLERFDLIHVHFAGEAAEFAYGLHLETQIPYAVTVHAVDLFCPRPSFLSVLKHAAAVFTISEHNQKALKKMGIDSHVIKCGIDIDFWQETPLPQGPVNALFVGRDVAKKGLRMLLDVWQEENGSLRIISDYNGPCPTNVQLLGLQPPTAVRQALDEANLFILPCQHAANGDMDGIPVVLMEAMAMGRPVITSEISGIPELVNDDVGWLLPPERPDKLKQAISLAKEEQRNKKGSQARQHLIAAGHATQHQSLLLWQHLQSIL